MNMIFLIAQTRLAILYIIIIIISTIFFTVSLNLRNDFLSEQREFFNLLYFQSSIYFGILGVAFSVPKLGQNIFFSFQFFLLFFSLWISTLILFNPQNYQIYIWMSEKWTPRQYYLIMLILDAFFHYIFHLHLFSISFFLMYVYFYHWIQPKLLLLNALRLQNKVHPRKKMW